jgi:hypothetical protein
MSTNRPRDTIRFRKGRGYTDRHPRSRLDRVKADFARPETEILHPPLARTRARAEIRQPKKEMTQPPAHDPLAAILDLPPMPELDLDLAVLDDLLPGDLSVLDDLLPDIPWESDLFCGDTAPTCEKP